MAWIPRRIFERRRVPLPDALWQAQLAAMPLLLALDAPRRARLRELCECFLADKTITGAAGLAVTPAMQLHIAAQACLPILELGLRWYRGWKGIVVYPAAFRVRRTVVDPDGLTHEIDEELSGEAWDGGPVVLSWQDAAWPAQSASELPGHALGNVVIHEFAHTLDLLDGVADGVPPFDRQLHAQITQAHWRSVLLDSYERFCAGLELVESEIAPDIDPESPRADRYYERLPLDPYAATDPAEFFAVASESYFLRPHNLQDAFPQFYSCLDAFYRPAPRK